MKLRYRNISYWLLISLVFLHPSLLGQIGQMEGDPFAGFQIMGTPRSNLPIGANWKLGIGPNGSGASSENLRVAQSYGEGNLSQSKDFELGLKGALAKWLKLDLSAGAEKDTGVDLEFDALEVVTVKDLTQLDILPNQSVLYEGLRVGKLKLVYDKSRRIGIEAELNEHFGNVETDLIDDKQVSSVVSGANLFVAYRLFTFGAPKVLDQKKEKLRFKKGRIKATFSKDVELEILYQDWWSCCSFKLQNNPQGKVDACAASNPVQARVRQLNRINLKGQPWELLHELEGTQFSGMVIPMETIDDQEGLISTYILLDDMFLGFQGVKNSPDIYPSVNTADATATFRRVRIPFRIEKDKSVAGW